ncbi:uncharacterized protein LOC131938746 [Physella acuta]|uniref:uncharacterized protein LOC131938746 n=1 Tax=Physella acuta TaxID=109671 RepID=UPI0027DBF3B6|nr:uncharacterized protein LOC131938746 [Physella acuta]
MSSIKATEVESSGLYYEMSPRKILVVRIFNVITLLMVVIAVIACFVQGHKNGSYYLLVCNLIISALVSFVVNWWYRKGDLESEKYWFVILVGAVIIFQCISTDVFVFKTDPSPTPTTLAPTTTHSSTTTNKSGSYF